MYSFQKRLQDRIRKGSYRSLLCFQDSIDFWSNDYLGLARIPFDSAIQGSTGSRLISGNSKEVEQVERYVSDFFGSEAALIFNSGYDANLGVFSSLPQKGDTILYDELIHASVRDGIRLSFASSFSFKHNDLSGLKKRLERAQGTIFVAIESLYSMDGDFALLVEIQALCNQFGALLIVDEAHAGGICGTSGKGLCEQLQVHPFMKLFTFGKAYGAHGAAVCCTEEVKSFLINFARSFIYTTSLPLASYRHIQEQIERSKDNYLRDSLISNINSFTSQIQSPLSASGSPIQVIPFGQVEECSRKAAELQELGIAVKAILPPTVPDDSPRLRFCIHAFNTEEEISYLRTALNVPLG